MALDNPMKILIVTDAWHPQVNGVVRTYEHLAEELTRMGHMVRVIGPHDFPIRLKMPGYAEIELALFTGNRLTNMIDAFAPDTIHIGTEGPLGAAARRYCLKRNLPFTTCYHTHFPDYAAKRAARIHPLFEKSVRTFFINRLRRFHQPSNALMVATPSLETTLKDWGFTAPMYQWARGARIEIFTPEKKDLFAAMKRPVAIYVGRVAIEKNIEAFLSMDWPGSKVVTGDGPDRAMLEAKYPNTLFTGKKTGTDLAAHYQSSDIFVFPSKTDTFGMVLIEALACGLPVAAYPVTGPKDIITEPMLGALDEDLSQASLKALNSAGGSQDRNNYISIHYAWAVIAQQFISIIQKSKAVAG
jgi:glycosyltransferase involved in cell wall biosynthesis